METRSKVFLKTIDSRFTALEAIVAARAQIIDKGFADILDALRLASGAQNLCRSSPNFSSSPKQAAEHSDHANAIKDWERLPIEEIEEYPKVEIHESLVHKAILEEESIPQAQVPILNLEHGLRFHKASLDVCEDSHSVFGLDDLLDHQEAILQASVVKARDVLNKKSTCVISNQAAHQVFDLMPQESKLLQYRRRKTFSKTWWFKFKEKSQPRELIQEKLLVPKANATMNQLMSPMKFVVDDLQSDFGSDNVCVSLVVVGDFQETPWFFNDDSKGNNSYVFQELVGMLLRSHILCQAEMPKFPKSWKFKFKLSSEDNKLTYTKGWYEKATQRSKKKFKWGSKPWTFLNKKRQQYLKFVRETEVDKGTEGIPKGNEHKSMIPHKLSSRGN